MMPKVPKEFCVDSFAYREYEGLNSWSEPSYKAPETIKYCRIDRGAEYTSTTSGKQLLYNAVIFCYAGITEPMKDFKNESKVDFDGQEHTIVKSIPIYEAYSNEIYAYELEVV